MTEVSIGKVLHLREKKDQKTYTKTDLVCYHRNRPSKYDCMSLEKLFYSVSWTQSFYRDDDTKHNIYQILVPKGLNCHHRYPIDYNHTRLEGYWCYTNRGVWKKPLGEILRNKQQTVVTFIEIVGSRNLLIYVMSEYNCAVKYAQQCNTEALTNEGMSLDSIYVKDMDQNQPEHHVEREHSYHLSGQ